MHLAFFAYRAGQWRFTQQGRFTRAAGAALARRLAACESVRVFRGAGDVGRLVFAAYLDSDRPELERVNFPQNVTDLDILSAP